MSKVLTRKQIDDLRALDAGRWRCKGHRDTSAPPAIVGYLNGVGSELNGLALDADRLGVADELDELLAASVDVLDGLVPAMEGSAFADDAEVQAVVGGAAAAWLARLGELRHHLRDLGPADVSDDVFAEVADAVAGVGGDAEWLTDELAAA